MPFVSSTSNPHAKRLRALRNAARRDRGGLVLLEGVRLCEEAIAAGLTPVDGVRDSDRLRHTDRGRTLDDALAGLGVLTATSAVLDAVSDTVTSQGVVMAVQEPPERWPDPLGPIVLVLDGIRDPGNVGTILRSASACGVVRAVAVVDCADPWGSKAVRAGIGAHFRLALLTSANLAETRARTTGRRWLVADSSAGRRYDTVDWRRECVLVIGGEAEGPSADSEAFADEKVTIPMAAGAESLNAGVAAAVLLFEAARQRGGPRSP